MTSPERGYLQELVVAGDAEVLKERLSTLLDVAGMLAIAIGLGWGLFGLIGPWSILTGGAVLLLENGIAEAARRVRLDEPPAAKEPKPAPGPDHPGSLHISGR